jgi:hypothetical protein
MFAPKNYADIWKKNTKKIKVCVYTDSTKNIGCPKVCLTAIYFLIRAKIEVHFFYHTKEVEINYQRTLRFFPSPAPSGQFAPE